MVVPLIELNEDIKLSYFRSTKVPKLTCRMKLVTMGDYISILASQSAAKV